MKALRRAEYFTNVRGGGIGEVISVLCHNGTVLNLFQMNLLGFVFLFFYLISLSEFQIIRLTFYHYFSPLNFLAHQRSIGS